MSIKIIDDTKLTSIANAIRAKDGSSAPIDIDDMPTAIANIPSGGGASFDWSQIMSVGGFTLFQYYSPVTGQGTCPAAFNVAGMDVSAWDDSQYAINVSWYGFDCSQGDTRPVIQNLDQLIVSNGNASVTNVSYAQFPYIGNTYIDLSSWNLTGADGFGVNGNEAVEHVNLAGWDWSAQSDYFFMFSDCTSLQSVNMPTIDTADESILSSFTPNDMFSEGTSEKPLHIIWSQGASVFDPDGMFFGSASPMEYTYFYVPDALVTSYQALTSDLTFLSINSLPAALKTRYGYS